MDKKKGFLSDLKLLFSPMFTGVLFIVFAIAMAVATFIENDYGAASARQIVYNSRWFELIFVLMLVNLVGQIFSFKLYRRRKLTVMLFHVAFIVMIIGAAITRYTGFEGRVHIREGQTVSQAISSDKYMGLQIAGSDGNIVFEDYQKLEVTGTSLGEFYRDGKIGNDKYSVRYSRYIPNATESVVDIQGGEAIAALVVTREGMFRDEVILTAGQALRLPGLNMGFSGANDIDITREGEKLFLTARDTLAVFSMMTREDNTYLPGQPVPFEEMLIYSYSGYRFVPQKISLSGTLMPVSGNDDMAGMDAFEVEVVYGGEMKKVYIYNIYSGETSSAIAGIGGLRFKLSYGPHLLEMPFALMLNDFIMDRYPGSSSPSGYQSDVVLIDKERGIEMPYSIYMNNILKHRGYRFYQSSFDPDERGTILSMNHDMAGMLVTYTGYALLFLFMILSLFNPNSVFRKLSPGMWRNSSSKILGILVVLLLLPSVLQANPTKIVYKKKKADEFGKVLVQDQKGRTKPLFTLSNDILRKVNRGNTYDGYSPMQVFLGFTSDFQNWQDEPVIKISNRELRSRIGATSEHVPISFLINFDQGSYLLGSMIDEIIARPEAQRSKMDKEVLKVDERVNIVLMMARGEFLKMFPLRDGTNNWGMPGEAAQNALNTQDSIYLQNILGRYTTELFEGISSGDYSEADTYLQSIIDYQRKHAGYDLPSVSRVKAEVMYYRMLIFEKLFPYYSTVGLVMLLILIGLVISGKKGSNLVVRGLSLLILAGFIFHTFGLGVRWYISGHSPMSNGYESLLFISWVTVLVGLGFGRRSPLTLASTAVLASLTLMVAHLSFMDPQITNLVPVLKSYWLTLHVSVITASYGFLGLGAILGLVNMILYALVNRRSRKQALVTIDELSVISYRSLTLGLYFLTIGTFLGAVWANESWGRYWGWDPKETWSLITMIVYAFVLHAKNIKGLKSIFTYNVMSVYAFASVLMTYFGVNYYLSGLHSYAGGDPVPVPKFVYYTIASLLVLTYISYRKYSVLAAGVKKEDD